MRNYVYVIILALVAWCGVYLLWFLITYAMPREAQGMYFGPLKKPKIMCYYPTHSDDAYNPPLCCWNEKEIPPDVFLGCVR